MVWDVVALDGLLSVFFSIAVGHPKDIIGTRQAIGFRRDLVAETNAEHANNGEEKEDKVPLLLTATVKELSLFGPRRP